jgi:tetratricopeptide (TPR) repeat protein
MPWVNLMKSLSPAETVSIEAAQEFLKLGKHAEAKAEVEKIGPDGQGHPNVLEVRWEICAQEADWQNALEIAATLCQIVPDNESGWLYQACCLDELKRTQAAFDILLTAAERFPRIPHIPYNLACLSCKLNRLKDASFWLGKAIELGGRAEVKLMALDDADLAPLLDQICAM